MLIASTVCFAVCLGVLAIVVLAIVRPDTDLSGAAAQVKDIVNTLIGLLAGFLAGRTEHLLNSSPEDEPEP